MERPQRGQWARAQRSSCWPQRQSLVRLQLARTRLVRRVVVWLSVRVTLFISPVVLVVTRKPTKPAYMTQKHRQ